MPQGDDDQTLDILAVVLYLNMISWTVYVEFFGKEFFGKEK